jgi:hypothetical protein
MIFKDFFENFFKNIPRIFKEYFPKSIHKSTQKVDRCGSCYPICAPKIFVSHIGGNGK